jgi:TRAP transporter 4TM/12TM fusion protein
VNTTDNLSPELSKESTGLKNIISNSFPDTIEGKILYYIAVIFSLFQVGIASHLIEITGQLQLSTHVGFLGLLCFPLISLSKQKQTSLRILAWVLAMLSVAVAIYQIVEYEALILRSGDPTPLDIVFGIIALIVIFAASFVTMGPALPIISGLFLLYCFFGNYLSGILQHRGYDLGQIIEHITYGTEGIYGIPTYVSSTYIFLFILFGSFLERAGVIKLFTDVSLGLVGHKLGGPAKVSIISSSLMGTISGSGVANVVTTGQFTIPLMKKFGYSPSFAGGVESTSSMGGQIMPPVMGAVAFIMAETLEIQYYEVVKAAIIPAILYYLSAFWMVHLEAGKKNLTGLPKEQLPSAYQAIKLNWYLIIPLVVLVFLLFRGYTPLYSGTIGLFLTTFLILGTAISQGFSNYFVRIIFWIFLGFIASGFFKFGNSMIAIILLILIVWNFLKFDGRTVLLNCRDALAEGAKTALPVGIACSVVGVIIGTLTLTGAASTIAQIILEIGEKSLFLSLFLTMIMCLILGMGIPTIPNYIITSAVAGPALYELGIPLIVSHMFVFYFGILADLTPPVALACFAAAPIAKESGFKISIQAVRVAIAGFLIPYMAVYSPTLMLQNYQDQNLSLFLISFIYILAKAIVAILFLGAAVIGYMKKDLNIFERLFCVIIACFLITAVPITDEIAGVLIVVYFVMYWLKTKKNKLV